ncbi:nicotinate-nucleotide--dimethylbenzimidazole phosphoribosyltransferase [Limosilactobacillus reuteri]|uniref:nicotinate-nucleotide--dimethylbenzimidazole phosphoribosyltransferase n=1 Tax=Limosilactobacillus reuteri TaxID=1598 RepID=UPI000C1B778E|nr:nicotinate-nucleotide--dimethylbenzimidazole phosphoribosyltransferase [Limosilactobacillus reuteri]PIN30285.1 nicotinate-nucleotide--dimethylbenzimidazole phosphoribosyltransferase [Limosilactobacillus reuteri]PUH34439.1 nicotinate-nucleotide--dimethylbenzimidazole phosphoribosyltransferase [Limosilactobacillus reuteri]PUH34445.1 nicotinate-nucleotide--dimethylbenzimidazole phosphoribosyltransferase [Limosilactobacillus reuteri]WLC95633.1 nicotinate-nucleotide--dimethylbenzimidazole phospho
MKYNEVEIKPLAKEEMVATQKKIDNLAKPVKGLGRLEELADHLAGIYRTTDFDVKPRKCLVFAADNGVVHEGVSASPQKITAIQAVNMMNGHTTVAALARAFNCDLQVYDVGIKTDLHSSAVKTHKIRHETGDMLHEPAMTISEANEVLQYGFDMGVQAFKEGNQIIATGELGMGNTTAASAIIAALLGKDGAEVVGRGSNISDKRMAHKVDVVNASLVRAGLKDKRNPDPLRVLSEVGALELGAMAGTMLAAGAMNKPVLLDGFLSYSAALLANTIKPGLVNYMIPTHKSKEQGSRIVLNALGLDPYIDINMCVGEGSGAMMLLPWLDGLKGILTNMNTLQEMDFNFIP